MKRIILSILILVSLSVHAQRPNAITFVDTTIIRDMNNGTMNLPTPMHAVDLGRDGYLISNVYDDGSKKFKFLLMKLNVDGTFQFDTIYNFNNASTYNGLISSVRLNNKSFFLSSNKKDQPFVVAINNTNGNFLWNKKYELDKYHSYYPYGLAVNEAANEAIVYGESSSKSSPYTTSSFIIKTDGSGNKLWTKDIGFSSPDSNYLMIQTAAMAKDGGYIFAANGFTKNGFISFLSLFKLDSTGNKVWENNFNLVNQSGKDTIMPDFYKTPRKIITFSDGSASLVSTYGDQQERDIPVIINFDQTTGNIIHSKKILYPNNANLNLLHVVKDKAYNGIVLNLNGSLNGMSYINRLLKMDNIGNFISAQQVIESPKNKSTDDNEALINTEDNGFLVISKNRDSSNNNLGYFISKLDKDFYSSCVDTIQEQFYVEDIKTYPININSNITTQITKTKSDTTKGSTPTNNLSGVSCHCKLSISGIVKDNNNNSIVGAAVYLYKVKKLGAFVLFDSTVTTNSGKYLFDYLPEEQFIIKAKTNIPNTVNTYYGSPNNQPNWDSAWVFDMSCTNPNLKNKDITLIQTVPQTGIGVIQGYVYELKGYGNNSIDKSYYHFDKLLGDPIPGIDITVNQDSGGIAGIKQTNKNGGYQFKGLINGESYTIAVDIPGLPNDSVYTIDVKVNNHNFDSLNFYVDSVGVYIIDSNTTGITVFKYNNLKVELSPNPTSKNVNLFFEVKKGEQVYLKLMDSKGTSLIEKRGYISQDEPKLNLSLSSLANGIYFIQIQFDNKVIVKKIIKQ